MNKAIIVTLVSAALFAAAMPTTTAGSTVLTGEFLIGEPVGFFALDACGESSLEGINSNCVAVSGVDGASYVLEATSASGTDVGFGVCFYNAAGFISCDDETVPAGTTDIAVYGLGGVSNTWTLTLTTA